MLIQHWYLHWKTNVITMNACKVKRMSGENRNGQENSTEPHFSWAYMVSRVKSCTLGWRWYSMSQTYTFGMTAFWLHVTWMGIVWSCCHSHTNVCVWNMCTWNTCPSVMWLEGSHSKGVCLRHMYHGTVISVATTISDVFRKKLI
jgi:hypothetical protein